MIMGIGGESHVTRAFCHPEVAIGVLFACEQGPDTAIDGDVLAVPGSEHIRRAFSYLV